MKRIVSVALAVLLLLSAVTTLSACRKKKGKTNIETGDWAEYTVVYNADSGTLLRDTVDQLAANLKERTGQKVTLEATGNEVEVETDDFEIIVGATDRTATEEGRRRVGTHGWCILPTGRKIVIYGTDPLFTVLALQTFMKTYLPAGGTGAAPVDLHEDVHADAPVVTVSEAQSLVFDTRLDNDKGSIDDSYRTAAENPDAYDYPVVAARQLRKLIAEKCGCMELNLALRRDNTPLKDSEITVGVTNRPISVSLMAELGNVHRYGFLVRDGQIAIVGFNDVTLRMAMGLFLNCMQALTAENGTLSLPDGLMVVKEKTTDNWITDFPLPDYEGLALTNSADVGQNSVEYYYTGTGVTTANYEAYCNVLTAKGYTLYTSNAIEGSLYRTYVNSSETAMLHVTYAAFAHAAEQKVTRYEPGIRIVSAPLGANPQTRVRLLEKEAFNPVQTYTRITDTRITAMQFNRDPDVKNWGNAYIITLEDGSFVILDGGSSRSGSADYIRLNRVLCDLYYLAHGVQPDQNEHRITLAAWYLSHSHADHIDNFIRFASNYGKNINAERLIANLASDSEIYNSYDPNSKVRDNITSILSSFNQKMVYYKVHAGWKFYIRNVEFEVLYTHEDLVPERMSMFNETSTVIRMTIYNTDGQGNRRGTPTTALWLGDLYKKGSQFLRATYGDYLQSDMCQVAHHGYNHGSEWELYQLVSPTCLWWPASYSEVTGWETSGNISNAASVVGHHLYYDLTSVRYIILNDLQNVTVTVTQEGPQYALEDLYNAAENETNPIVRYGSKTVSSSILMPPR